MITHCLKCGHLHEQINFPKKCTTCEFEMYKNPIPVAVVLIPVKDKGLLLVLRGNDSGKGKWALPGGFVDYKESPFEAGIREVKEEVQVILKNPLKILGIEMSSNKENMIIFFESEAIEESEIKFKASEEVEQISFVKKDFPEIAFSSHEKYIRNFCREKYGEEN